MDKKAKPTKSDLRAKLASLSNEPVQGALLEVIQALVENSSLDEKEKPAEEKPAETPKPAK